MLPDEASLRFSGPFATFEVDLAVIDPIRVVIKQNLGYVELSYGTANARALMVGQSSISFS